MDKFDQNILNIDRVICENITLLKEVDRGILSQNILSQLRNFVEAVNLKIYSKHVQNAEIDWKNIQDADKFVAKQGKLRFLTSFYNLLEESKSHYTPNHGNAERLMLKYYGLLLKIKIFLTNEFHLEVLKNLEDFPVDEGNEFAEFYRKIAKKIDEIKSQKRELKRQRYYIHKVKPFFIDGQIYYEVTFSIANDYVGKFDRMIAFTKIDMMHDYSVRMSFEELNIEIDKHKMPIKIITSYEVSIRPCEIKNFAKIFHMEVDPKGNHSEYKNLMRYLTENQLNLLDLLLLDDSEYQQFKNFVIKGSKVLNVEPVLGEVLKFLKQNKVGSNVVRYLMLRLNNKIIKRQLFDAIFIDCENDKLSDLNLKSGCKQFDTLPFIYSLCEHNPVSYDLFRSIGSKGHEEEMIARSLKVNADIFGMLYTSKQEIEYNEEIKMLIEKYNNKLDTYQQSQKICEYNDHLYIKSYECDTIEIIERLRLFTNTKGNLEYVFAVKEWLKNKNEIDEEKRSVLQKLFENDNIAVIYGAAGTGKTTLIEQISNIFAHKNKLFVATTNPAVENLRRRIKTENSTFKTIKKFTTEMRSEYYDVLFVDESSTVSNFDMLKILKKENFGCLILVGDTFQIESISFGNWFSLCKSFLPKNVIFELIKTYRSSNPKLVKLWKSVREIESLKLKDITEQMIKLEITEENFSDGIFTKSLDDEIILCLNYDGLYGINNINQFLQDDNKNEAVRWGEKIYKVGDPILFNDTRYFAPVFYNNLKGKLDSVCAYEDYIEFEVTIDRELHSSDLDGNDKVKLVDFPQEGKTQVSFIVNRRTNDGEDDDDVDSNTIIPFQIAYAVSIHKAQGLEYDSVKIVINRDMEELITHNIFYTAITRAKQVLKIYWQPETQKTVLENLKPTFNKKDSLLLRSKLGK